MLIKTAEGRERDIETLQTLLRHPSASDQTRQRIEREIRNIQAGDKGEREAAYEIEFHHKSSNNWAILHDLRIEWQGRVAQIDHLLINRFLDIWVCESKHFSEGVSINAQGEFTAFFRSKPYGVPSPLEQNRKHALVLQALLNSSVVQLPSRLGIPLRPSIKTVVLVSKNARIGRPSGAVDGIDTVIKCDALRTLIEKGIDDLSVAATFLSATKMVSGETVAAFAEQLARLHRPIQFDWAAKFGLGREATVVRPTPRPVAFDASEPQNVAAGGRPAASGQASGDELEKIPTSKIAARLGARNTAEALETLAAAGYLVKQGGELMLTQRAKDCGAVWIEKGRFGPYFLWPAALEL